MPDDDSAPAPASAPARAPAPSPARAKPRPFLLRLARAVALFVAFLALFTALLYRAFFFHFPTTPAPSISRQSPDFEALVTARATTLLDRYATHSNVSGVALLRIGDHLLLDRALGDTPTTTTRFTCGSLPKQLTGLAIHRLAQRHLLTLDDPLSTHLPELRGSPAGTATITQALHMTSGLPRSVDASTNLHLQRDRSAWMDDAELLRRIRAYQLDFPPGTRFSYSNVGYRLLAMIAQRVTSTPFPIFMHREVFTPAAMFDAGHFEPNVPPPPDLVVGHMPYRCHVVAGRPCMMSLPHWNYSALWGAGAVHLRASDLLAWSTYLARLRREEPDLFAAYSAPALSSYASGIETTTLPSTAGEPVRVHGHTGEDPGYDAYFAWLPAGDIVHDDITIVVLTNTDYGPTGDYSLGDELRDLVAGRAYRVVE